MEFYKGEKQMAIKKGDQVRFCDKVTPGVKRTMKAAGNQKRNPIHGQEEVFIEGFGSPFLVSNLVKVSRDGDWF